MRIKLPDKSGRQISMADSARRQSGPTKNRIIQIKESVRWKTVRLNNIQDQS
jgi:hypothetical protein